MKIIKYLITAIVAITFLCNTVFASNLVMPNTTQDTTAVSDNVGVSGNVRSGGDASTFNAAKPFDRQSEEYVIPNINTQLFSQSISATENQSTTADDSGTGAENEVSLESTLVSPFSKCAIPFQVTDSTFDPLKPVVYLTDKTNKQLHAINYTTGESAVLSFEYTPESLVYANGEIYVTLLISGHQYYGSAEKGAVAIVDPDTMMLKDQFYINIDPYDIEADNNYIYITSGSNQWTRMRSYSIETQMEVSNTGIRAWSYGKLHPSLSKIYTIDTDSSPRDIRAYNLTNGTFTDATYPGGYDSPYHGDYSMAVNFEISPDGKYIFNGAGTIFNCDANKARDIIYKCTLDSRFTDIVFDLPNNSFYTATTNNLIAMYDYELMQRIGQCPIDDDVVSMNLNEKTLAAICKNDNNEFFIETMVLPGASVIPVEQPVEPNTVALNGNISSVIYDAIRDRAYAADKGSKNLYVVNMNSHQIERTVNLPYTPADLCISEDGQKLFIANYDKNIMVTEVDISSFTITRNLAQICYDWSSDDVVHRHIYERGNRLYIIGGEWGPILYVFNVATLAPIITGTITQLGDMGFLPDNSSFFYWQQYGWSAGYAGSDIYRYSIGATGDTYTLADQTGMGYPTLKRDPLDTPLLILPNKGTIICKNNEYSISNVKNIVYTFPESIYAVNSDETVVAGKSNIYRFNEQTGTWIPRPLVTKGDIKELFFAGDRLISLSNTNGVKGTCFLEEIWYGERYSISGKIKLGFVPVPTEGLRIQIDAVSGDFCGKANYIMKSGEIQFTISDLPAATGYSLSYTIFSNFNGKSADDYGFKPKGYFNSDMTVEEVESATQFDLTADNAVADILLLGNREISGDIALPDGDTAPEGGIQLYLEVSNQNDSQLYSVNMPSGADHVPYSINVPSTAPYYCYNVACYQFGERYMLACGYSDTGTVAQKKFSNDVLVKVGDRYNIDITLIEARKICGTVSLPGGETARTGGMDVEVFAKNGEFSCYKDILIPEGEGSAEYELMVPKFIQSTIGFYMNAFGDNGDQNIHNYYHNSSKAMYIPNGEISSDYVVGYNLSVDYGYQTTGFYGTDNQTVSMNAANVGVLFEGKSNLDLTILKGDRTISGRIDLPAGSVAPAGGLDVYLLATNPQLEYSLCSYINIPQGERSGSYSISVPALTDYSVCYSLDDNSNSGYVPYGYYSQSQTTVNQEDAYSIDTSAYSSGDIHLSLVPGVAVSGIISVPAMQVDIKMIVALWNDDFEIDRYVTIQKSKVSQRVPYTIYVPANNDYCAQYMTTSRLDGYLQQGYYSGPYQSSVGYFTQSRTLYVENTAMTNIGFSLIVAGGIITGTISLPNNTQKSSYCIFVPDGPAGYMVYYRIKSISPATYIPKGYYSATGTSEDVNLCDYVFLSDGAASSIDLALLLKSAIQINGITPSSVDLCLANDMPGNVFVAVYNGEGKMLTSGYKTIVANVGEVSIILAPYSLPDEYYIKVFLLSGGGFMPLCEEYTRSYSLE